MDHSGPNRTKVDRIDKIGPMWTKQNFSRQNGLNRIKYDQIGPKMTE